MIDSFHHLSSNANDPASRSAACIPRGLALLVSSLAQIVSTRMHNDGTAEDALGTDQLDEFVGDRAFRVALAVGLEVA